jgi:hypothetical protein
MGNLSLLERWAEAVDSPHVGYLTRHVEGFAIRFVHIVLPLDQNTNQIPL